MRSKKEDSDIQMLGVLYEDMQDNIKKVLEIVKAQQSAMSMIPKMSEDIEELKSDTKAVKAAVTATNQDVIGLKQRVSILESV